MCALLCIHKTGCGGGDGGAFVCFAARAQHGYILLMALTVTLGIRSGILKLPELSKVTEEPNPLVFIVFLWRH